MSSAPQSEPNELETHQRKPAKPNRRKPRRWLRRLLVGFLLALAILLPLINGPIFRGVAKWKLGQILHDLYLNESSRSKARSSAV